MGEQQFGLEIRLLREKRQLSAKELARAVGLSPSQMSRLESGQRRVDAVLLSKIARALDVHPSYFFGGFESEERPARSSEPPTKSVVVATPASSLGKIIRAERRRRHFTAEELAHKVGKGKTFILDLESGRTDLVTGELLVKLARSLKLDPEVLLEAQRTEIHELRRSLRRLERAHTERTLGELRSEETGTRRGGIPIVQPEHGNLPHVFDKDVPEGRVVDYVFAPELGLTQAFAVVWRGDDMRGPSPPSFASGDLLVFRTDRDARHMEFVLAVLPDEARFRRLYLDPKGRIRLQPLNLDYPPRVVERSTLTALYPLAARIQTF